MQRERGVVAGAEVEGHEGHDVNHHLLAALLRRIHLGVLHGQLLHEDLRHDGEDRQQEPAVAFLIDGEADDAQDAQVAQTHDRRDIRRISRRADKRSDDLRDVVRQVIGVGKIEDFRNGAGGGELGAHIVPDLEINHAQGLHVRHEGRKRAVRHPEVLNPQERLDERMRVNLRIMVEGQELGNQLLVREGAQRVEHRKQDDRGNQHRQAGAHRVDAFLAVKLLDLLVELFLIVLVFFLQSLLLGGEAGHAHGRTAALQVERHHHQLDENGKDDDRQRIVVDNRMQRLNERQQQRIEETHGRNVLLASRKLAFGRYVLPRARPP